MKRTLLGAGLLLTMATLSTTAHADPTQGGVGSVLVGDGEDLRRMDGELAQLRTEFDELELEAQSCVDTNAACDYETAALRKKQGEINTKISELDISLVSVQVYLYGVGGTSAAPKSGSLAAWQQDAERRLIKLEAQVARHEVALYGADTDGDGLGDGGGALDDIAILQDEMKVVTTDLYGNVDEDGDSIPDGMIAVKQSDGSYQYTPSLTARAIDNAERISEARDEVWIGGNVGLDFRKGYDSPVDANDIPGASFGGGLTMWYQNHRMDDRPTVGLYGTANAITGAGGGFSGFVGPTVTTNWGRSYDLSFGGGLRYTEIGSFDGSAYALRSVGAGFPLIVSYRFGEGAMVTGSVMPTATYDAGEWGYGLFAASTVNVGALVRF